MCGYVLQTEIRTEQGWQWFGRFGYAIKQEGSFEQALGRAQQAVRQMKAEHGGSWGSYRLIETNCRNDAWQLDLHSGTAKKRHGETVEVYPGSAFHPTDQEREERDREFLEELMARGGALSRNRMRRVISADEHSPAQRLQRLSASIRTLSAPGPSAASSTGELTVPSTLQRSSSSAI